MAANQARACIVSMLARELAGQDVDTNMDTTAIGYESFPVSAGRAGAV
jgi:hypothetical protein